MSPKDAGMEALKRIKSSTIERRLLNARGESSRQSQRRSMRPRLAGGPEGPPLRTQEGPP